MKILKSSLKRILSKKKEQENDIIRDASIDLVPCDVPHNTLVYEFTGPAYSSSTPPRILVKSITHRKHNIIVSVRDEVKMRDDSRWIVLELELKKQGTKTPKVLFIGFNERTNQLGVKELCSIQENRTRVDNDRWANAKSAFSKWKRRSFRSQQTSISSSSSSQSQLLRRSTRTKPPPPQQQRRQPKRKKNKKRNCNKVKRLKQEYHEDTNSDETNNHTSSYQTSLLTTMRDRSHQFFEERRRILEEKARISEEEQRNNLMLNNMALFMELQQHP